MDFYTTQGRLCARTSTKPARTAKYDDKDSEQTVPFRDEMDPVTADNSKINHNCASEINLKDRTPVKTDDTNILTFTSAVITGSAVTVVIILLLLTGNFTPASVKNLAMKSHIPVQVSNDGVTHIRPVQVKIKLSDNADAGDSIIKIKKSEVKYEKH